MDTCIFFHCGNFTVFNEIINQYNNFFSNDKYYYISCSDFDVYNKLVGKFVNSVVSFTNNKGCDIGGVLTNIDKCLKSDHYKNFKYFYFIHTKTDKVWRDKMLNAILNNDITKLFGDKPLVIGSNDYRFNNNKMINRTFLKEIFIRNNIKLDYEKFYDRYIFEDDESIERDVFLTDESFYRGYEDDLSQMNDEEILNHWFSHGINEFHRINNASLITKYGEESYFIAGTVFCINKEYMNHFKCIDIQNEISLLETGYRKNHVPTRIHSWEYFFGLFCHCLGGNVIGIDDNGNVNNSYVQHNFNHEIYKNFNPDLRHMSNNELISHFYNHGIHEKRIHSLYTIKRKQSIINFNPEQSTVAFFLMISDKPISGGYRTLLKYINYLSKNGYKIDIYIGSNTEDMNRYMGYSTLNIDIEKLVKYIDAYNEINVNEYNFFLGLKCNKRYRNIVANAWQISEAVYLNRNLSDSLIYIIQDEEYLFFPNDKEKQDYIISTYKKEFKYFCVTKYLSNKFKDMGFDVFESFLGVDCEIYKNLNKKRDSSICIGYFSEKVGRLPNTIVEIIKKLSQKYKCKVFPSNYNTSNKNIINMGKLTPIELSELYNTCSVGIIFSNTNPSRIGYEMMACGLKVIEYDSEFTKYDLDNCSKFKIGDDIEKLVEYEINSKQKYTIKNVNDELNNILKFFNQINNYNYEIKAIYDTIGFEMPFSNTKYSNKTAICISGSYRTFDFCKKIFKHNILNHLLNYDVYILLSDENEHDIEKKMESIYEFFSDNLKFFMRTSQMSKSEKDFEIQEYNKFKDVCDIQNVAFNTRAQFRRKLINDIKNKFDNYEYTIIARFDVFYFEPLKIQDKIWMHNDTLIVGKTKYINILMDEIGNNFMKYVYSFPDNLPLLLKINPEYIYKNIIDDYSLPVDYKYMTMHVRCLNNGYDSKYYETIFIDNVYVVRPKISILPKEFNVKKYKKYNSDLQFMSDFEAFHHYIYAGRFENRKIIK